MIVTQDNISVTLRDSIRWSTQKKSEALLYDSAKTVMETTIKKDEKGNQLLDEKGNPQTEQISKTEYSMASINKSHEILMLDMVTKIEIDGKEIAPKEMSIEQAIEEYFTVGIGEKVTEAITELRTKKTGSKKK